MSYPDNSVTFTLDHPYKTQAGTEVKEVTMRSPIVRDRILRSRDRSNDIEADVRMIAQLCGLSYDDILNMEGADYMRLENQFNVFLLPGAKAKNAIS